MNRLFAYCVTFTILIISIAVLSVNFISRSYSDEKISVEHYVAGF